MKNEVIASYQEAGISYEIDHLGIGRRSQWGEFAVYSSGVQLAEFSSTAAGVLGEAQPSLPTESELVALAKTAVAEADSHYPCDQCGDEGKHHVSQDGTSTVIECRICGYESVVRTGS